MNRISITLAATVVAAGILGLGSPPAAHAMDRGMHEHLHDMKRLHRHHPHRDGNNGGFLNWCYMHPRVYDQGTGTYLGADGYRHYCESPISY